MGGFGRSWKELGGVGRNLGRARKGLGGIGRSWEELGVVGRSWEVMDWGWESLVGVGVE